MAQKKINQKEKNMHIHFLQERFHRTPQPHSQYKQEVMGVEKLGTRPSYFGSCLLVCCISSLETAARENGTTFLLKLLPKLAHCGVRQVSAPG